MLPYIWDNPQYDEPILPQQAPVQRREPRAQVDVPPTIWFIPNPSEERTVMIRQEYHEVMLGILQWMHHRMETRARTTQEIEVDSSDWWLEGMPSPNDVGVVHAPPLYEMDTYPNPFLGQEGVTTTGGLVLTGLPGIGTSSFLWVLFNLRIAAGLPTLYATRTPAVLWRNGKGYLIDMDQLDRSEIQAYLPNDTWCLVDSNAALTSMPEALIDDDLFIIQAASPGTNRMQWMRKVVDTHYFIMKPWNCGELIAGKYSHQCQDTHQVPLNEAQLSSFYNLYGGSARDAYSFAYRPTEFEQRVAQELHRLQTTSIQEALILVPSSIPKSTNHLVLSFLPIDDRKRTIWKVDSPSPHLHNRLLTQLGRNPQQTWFNLLSTAATPGSKAVAARMFDAFYHNRIIRGGAWTLRRPNYSSTATKLLISDKGIRITDRKPWGILPSSPIPTCTFDEWPIHQPFDVGTYYHATQRKFAFFVDGIGHAILFLARRQTEKSWLEERGIQRVTCVYVTPKEEEEVSLSLEDSGFYDAVYCMYLEYGK